MLVSRNEIIKTEAAISLLFPRTTFTFEGFSATSTPLYFYAIRTGGGRSLRLTTAAPQTEGSNGLWEFINGKFKAV